jgi:hypothetical protein
MVALCGLPAVMERGVKDIFATVGLKLYWKELRNGRNQLHAQRSPCVLKEVFGTDIDVPLGHRHDGRKQYAGMQLLTCLLANRQPWWHSM